MSAVPSFDTTSLEDLVALAQAQGLHVEDETDRDHVVGLVQASVVADLAEGEVTGGRGDASAAAAASATDERFKGGDGAGAGAGGRGDGGGGGPSSTRSPPRHLSPMSFGSPLPGAPPPQRLSDILALDGMIGRPSHGDTSSSVSAEVGSRTGRGGGGASGGASGGGGDSDMEASSSSHSSYSTAAVVNSVSTAAAAAVAGSAGGGGADHPGGSGGGEDLTEERREALETFMAFTQVGSSVSAAQFLDATDWSPDAAINLFLESGGDTAAVAAVAAPPPPQRGLAAAVAAAAAAGGAGYGAAARSGGARGWPSVGGAAGGYGDGQSDADDSEEGVDDHDDVGANPFSALGELAGLVIPPAPAGAAAGRPPPPPPPQQQDGGGGGGGGAAGGGGGSPGEQDHLYPGGFSEDGVRAPIPARTDRLIGGGGVLGGVAGGGGGGRGAGMMLGGMLGGAMAGAGRSSVEEKDNTDWIFKAPEGLSFSSDFLETRQICKEQKKWLMVNIQDHQEFASHRLNKDVWSNETILTLLRGNFIFWQRNKALRQARYYVDKYNLEGEVLPHTAILDPRTGAQLLKVVGFVEPEDLSMALVEFLENNTIDQVKAPAVKTIGMGNIAHHGYNQTPGKGGGGVSERTSPDNSVGMYSGGRGGGRGDASLSRDSAYESFGSEEYVYEDDDDLGQGSSFDVDDNSTANSNASPAYHPQTTPNAKPSPPATTRSSSPSPPTVAGSGRSSPSRTSAAATGGGGDGKSAKSEPPPPGGAGAIGAAAGAGLVGPWGRGTPEDELRAEGGGERVLGEPVEVPQEPDAGNGVTQVQFRLAGGGTIARRFWLKDRVSLLFQFVRTTGEEAATRPFDLLSGHPPSSLLGSKVSTLEAANLSNSAIMVRWL